MTMVHSLLPLPKQPDHLVVGERSANVYIMTTRGQPVTVMTSGKSIGGDFTSCALSSRGALLFCAAEDSHVYCFEVDSGKLVSSFKVGVAACPCQSLSLRTLTPPPPPHPWPPPPRRPTTRRSSGWRCTRT